MMDDAERFRAEVEESLRVIADTLEKAALPQAEKDALISEAHKLRRSAFEEGYAAGRKRPFS
jgi:hypothetical protein